MQLPTISAVFDLGGSDGRHSHAKMMGFTITAAAIVRLFTSGTNDRELILWLLLFSASHGLAGLRYLMQGVTAWLGRKGGQ